MRAISMLVLLLLGTPVHAGELFGPLGPPAQARSEPRFAAGVIWSGMLGGTRNDRTELINTGGVAVSGRVTENGSAVATLTYGLVHSYDEFSEYDDEAILKEGSVGYAYALCHSSTRVACLLPSGSVGYDTAKLNRYGEEETNQRTWRMFAEGRFTARLLGGAFMLQASLGLRYFGKLRDSSDGAGIVVGAGMVFAF